MRPSAIVIFAATAVFGTSFSQAANLTDRTALYNFQSVFVGTRVVQPRTLSAKVRWYW